MPQITPTKIQKIKEGVSANYDDLVAVEEPLEIRLGFGELDFRQQKSISVTMRTPTNDFDLALGFLFTENIIKSYSEILSIKYCRDTKKQTFENIIRVELKPDVIVNLKERNFYMTSSCGVCGKASIESIEAMTCDLPNLIQNFTISPDFLYKLPDLLTNHQKSFAITGGLHAAAIFNQDSELILLREDIGRHNALDKVIGAALQQNLLLNDKILLMSSRASFELIQKAVMAQISIIACIGAASSLAIETAERFEITLIGFLREKQFNVYSGFDRVKFTT
jgi:FdhD protein